MSNVNLIGVEISKPNMVLVINRGVSGSGKSTMAKDMVKNGGIIHSTDDVISKEYDYDAFFNNPDNANRMSLLGKAHRTNFDNFKKSVESRITPIIIDNTNLLPSDIKPYVTYALNSGYSDENIRINNIGLNNKTPEELAKRNIHNVSLEKINKMVSQFNSFKNLTLMDIVNSKDRKKILYSAVVLTDESVKVILEKYGSLIPENWKIIAHHMTIKFGKGVESGVGDLVNLTVTHMGFNDMCIALKVKGYESENKNPHITLAINEANGAKPKMSNDIENWIPVNETIIGGIITNVTN